MIGIWCKFWFKTFVPKEPLLFFVFFISNSKRFSS